MNLQTTKQPQNPVMHPPCEASYLILSNDTFELGSWGKRLLVLWRLVANYEIRFVRKWFAEDAVPVSDRLENRSCRP
jgi:hypothetical protein